MKISQKKVVIVEMEYDDWETLREILSGAVQVRSKKFPFLNVYAKKLIEKMELSYAKDE